MKFLVDMRIASKILAAILTLGVVALGVAGVGSLELTRMAATMDGLIGKQAESLKLAAAANEKVARLHQLRLERLVETDPADLPALRAKISETRAELGDLLRKLEPFLDGEDAAEFKMITAGLTRYDALMEPVEDLLVAGNESQARQRAQDQGGDLFEEMDKVFNGLVARQDAHLDAGALEAKASASSMTWWLLACSILGIAAVAAASVYLVARTITRPLGASVRGMGELARGNHRIDIEGAGRKDEVGQIARALTVFRTAAIEKAAADAAKAAADAEQALVVETLERNLGKLAQGDLSSEINEHFSPSYESVKRNFNSAIVALRGLIGSVKESSVAIRTGSGEIAQASEDLARRTEANAASLEETSAAITQMDDRLKATAAAANRTVECADSAIQSVVGGRGIADEAVQAMGRVADSAKGIDSVIEGLDKIAFQTRVLAMNAAVEAGRAGEAGRGFAVVADLVSALAMRAEEEAGRARDQLTATQTDIMAAVDMVQKVDHALETISSGVGEVHSLLGRMASDNQAQSTAITEISAAIGAMDQSTQQNAAMVEQTSAAARNLSSEVSMLADQAGKFETGNQASRLQRASAPVRKPVKDRSSYVSPVKALPVPATADGDWASF